MYCQIIEFATPLYDESVRLRDEMLRKPLNLEFTKEQLAEEWNQMHLAVIDDTRELIGILVLVPQSDEIVKMRQVAVRPDMQSKGVGRKLVEFSEKVASEHGFKIMELNARKVAVPFYDKLDYKKEGKEFTEVNIPHFKMIKEL